MQKIYSVKKLFIIGLPEHIKTLLLLALLVFPEAQSFEAWEYYSSKIREIATPFNWPIRDIYYLFKSNFLTVEKNIIQQALKTINQKTCLRFSNDYLPKNR